MRSPALAIDSLALFTDLLMAETEAEVTVILERECLLNDDPALWRLYGDQENNFGTISNQHADATGALVEKLVNSIDAMLMAKCYEQGSSPEASDAPRTMTEAVECFFAVPGGKIGTLNTIERSRLADNIHLVATGSREHPNYLIIDRGEGQTPKRLPDTILSLNKRNKMNIHFVQGKYNTGGTGVIQFCGEENYHLVVSRRQPSAPVLDDDGTANLWGWTLVRRLFPEYPRKVSEFIYLAPEGDVPSFEAPSILVLPGPGVKGSNGKKAQPGLPYSIGLEYGTCIKLYEYEWKNNDQLLSNYGKRNLHHYLHAAALPVLLHETRPGLGAQWFETVLSGGWTSATSVDEEGESDRLEAKPNYEERVLPGIGKLSIQVAVFKEGRKSPDRNVNPYGVFFTLNGQTHGEFPANFVSQKVKFAKLEKDLFALIDCTEMNERIRENFFMASRDRVRDNATYRQIEKAIIDLLRDDPFLNELNQRRRQSELDQRIDEVKPRDLFQELINKDPGFARLLGLEDKPTLTATGPKSREAFVGRQFPTYFHLLKQVASGYEKKAPIGMDTKVVFETDAVNDYFDRDVARGLLGIMPAELYAGRRLRDGRCTLRFHVPETARVGDRFRVTVMVEDEHAPVPFTSTFTLVAVAPVEPKEPGSNGARPPKSMHKSVPEPIEVHRDEWYKHEFDEHKSFDIESLPEGGYDFYLNVESKHLITGLADSKEEQRGIVKYWLKWGLAVLAFGMINEASRVKGDDTEIDLRAICDALNGAAQVLIPILRTFPNVEIK